VSSESKAEFTYNYLPDDIHELILHTPTPSALHECLQQVKVILYEAQDEQPIRLLSDIRQSGIPPVGQLWELTRYLFDLYPQHPAIYDAILHNLEGKFLQSFLALMGLLSQIGHAKVGFFNHDQRDQAIAWLLEQSSHTTRDNEP
jgi:hypothetical protein